MSCDTHTSDEPGCAKCYESLFVDYMTLLEQRDWETENATLLDILRDVQAWRDSDGNEGFPHELRLRIRAALAAVPNASAGKDGGA